MGFQSMAQLLDEFGMDDLEAELFERELRSRDPKDDGWWPPLSGERDEFGEVTE
jgi:hypothetical protein